MKEGPFRKLARFLLESRYPLNKAPSGKVAVMVPLPTPELREDEEISLIQLRRHLDGYEKFLLVPKGLDVSMDGFRRMELDRRHFGSAANHNRMLFLLEFWSLFRDYEYVLMYHLDALVFRDELLEWCGKDVDFIGAPWVICEHTPWVKEEQCGNGGFALYRIPSVMEVLINRQVAKPKLIWIDRFSAGLERVRKRLVEMRENMSPWLLRLAGKRLDSLIWKLGFIEVNYRPNDYFWGMDAVKYKADFRVGSLEEGLGFAFEADPEKCLERTSGKLPFGAHAWGRYDRKFWERHLFPAQA